MELGTGKWKPWPWPQIGTQDGTWNTESGAGNLELGTWNGERRRWNAEHILDTLCHAWTDLLEDSDLIKVCYDTHFLSKSNKS